MLKQLPGWAIEDAASVREEVQEWIGLSPAERWRLALQCSADALWAVKASGHATRILDRVEPLPESTRAALDRLRAEAGWGKGDP